MLWKRGGLDGGCTDGDEQLQRHRVLGVVIMDRKTAWGEHRRMGMIHQVGVNETPVVMRGVMIVEVGVQQTALPGAELHDGHKTRCDDPSHSLIVRDPGATSQEPYVRGG